MYKPTNILVTGGAGFIGSHVVRSLVNHPNKYLVVVIDMIDYCSSLRNLADIQGNPNYVFIKGDITSYLLMRKTIIDYAIDTVMHFAASTHVDASFTNSFEFTQNNVLGTHVLLEASRDKVKRFIHVSTDEVYGETRNNVNCVEESILAPTNPYSATKASAEFMVKAYFKSFNLPVIITRSNNVYGAMQYPEKIIPKFIMRLLRGKSCLIHGTGKNSRRYLFIDDVVSAFDLILHRGAVGEVYNIGTDVEVSNISLAKMLIQEINPDGQIEYVEDRHFNDRRYAIDSQKLREIGWSETTPFQEGLKKTIAWYAKHGVEWWSDLIRVDFAHSPRRQEIE